MDILSIGNSFSQDAQRYIHKIAKADGVKLNTFNLYIGGCSLATHYRNMLSKKAAYTLEMNGESTGFKTSLTEALLNRSWDVITVQQASIESPHYETYHPYLNKLVEYIKICVPKAKIAIHQTWAYEQGSNQLNSAAGYQNHIDMFNDIKTAYKKAAESINADFTIPSGELFQNIISAGINKIHRDTYHASYGLGRYALGLLWYTFFTENDILNNTFSDFDENITNAEINIAKKCVANTHKMYL